MEDLYNIEIYRRKAEWRKDREHCILTGKRSAIISFRLGRMLSWPVLRGRAGGAGRKKMGAYPD